ncbi:peptidyl-prolyl cis-trans isomerase [Heliophilum fasciatum]|uniref:Peptidyl-prolyl cis-trans isomerase C n=1 Tax=Heliophilum fasciatum TaxID=35700 RepID=A0A4R2RZW9_9FIRM|nr:peptidyl-prolyl cis-trans isomerase [Heliophilum fasciatum]MCW2277027.1 peptidyl-prolyl cis-trans isomerase C [Heliophilum fasciatum]TCP68447.1 peptidyl-prolyl cis-trans isomerase C [Heliophilum fasciatum]
MKWIRQAGVLGLIVMLFVTAGCGQSQAVATVNGDTITRAELDKRLDRYKNDIAAQAENEDTRKQQMAMLEQQELDRMIDETLLEQEAKKRNVQITEQQVEEELAKTKQSFASDTDYQEALKQSQMTEADVKEMTRMRLMAFAVYEQVTADVAVTDNEIAAYYQANPERFKTGKQVRASHILLKTEAEAKDVIDQLQKGADFAQLAATRSIDPSAAQNKGDLGFFEQSDMVKEFADAAFAMKSGDTSKTPVKSSFGYHVIRVVDSKEPHQQTLEEARDQLKVDLPAEKKETRFTNWFNEMKAQATIDRKLPPLAENDMGPLLGAPEGTGK